jgi:hypothetical protein
MKLEQLVQQVETQLVEFGRRLLSGDPRERLQEEVDWLAAELAQRRTALAERRKERDETSHRIEENQAAVLLLPSQIESSVRRGKSAQAYRQALELDRLRRTLAADRVALPRLEQTCWSLAFLIRQIERHLARQREQLADHDKQRRRR